MTKEKKEFYKLTLETVGKEYKTEGETVDEALEKLPLEWHNIKGKGIIKISKGKNKIEKLFYMAQLRKIISNKLVRKFWSHNLTFLMK